MSNILTDWRAALVTHLTTNLQSGSFDAVESGFRDGPSFDRKIAAVFVSPHKAWQADRNVNYAHPEMMIRAWLPQAQQPKAVVPVPPGPLEQLAVDLMDTLEPVQTTLLVDIYFWVSTIRLDYKDWGIEATLTSETFNRATLPA